MVNQPRQTWLVVSTTKEESERLSRNGPRRDYLELAEATGGEVLYVEGNRRAGGLLGRLLGPHVRQAWRAASIARNGDAIYADGEHIGIPLSIFLRLRRRRRVKLVFIGHLLTPRWKLRALRMATMFGSKATVVVHSVVQKKAVDSLLRRGWRSELVPYQVDTEFWNAPAPMEKPERPLFVAAGSENRDYPTLIEAARLAPDVDVVIASGSHWARRQAGSGDGQLPPNVRFLTETLGFAELRDLYAKATAVVVPLHDVDNQSGITTMLEGMSMGLPVIVSATNGQRECVSGPLVGADGSLDEAATADRGPQQFGEEPGSRTGFYVPPGDARALAAAMAGVAAPEGDLDPVFRTDSYVLTLKRLLDARGRFHVLFIQSQAFFGADTELHYQLMRNLDREHVRVSVALTTERLPQYSRDARSMIETVPALTVVDSNFGFSREASLSLVGKAASAARAAATLIRIVAFARREGVSVVHCTEKPRDVLFAWFVARLSGARVGIHMHVRYDDWMSPIVRRIAPRSDAIFAISEFVAEGLVERGFLRGRVLLIRNCLDTEHPRWNVPFRPVLREELGLNEETVVIGLVARLFHWKGHRRLLDAFAALPQIDRCHLVFVGDDDPRAEGSGRLFSAELKARADELGLRNVSFVGFREDVANVMDSFDVYAMPSWEEPFGMVYLEAMYRSRPVLALDSGGAREIVVHGSTGLLADPWQPGNLAEQLAAMVEDPVLRARMGACGRRRVQREFSSKQMCAQALDAYAHMIGITAGQAPKIGA